MRFFERWVSVSLQRIHTGEDMQYSMQYGIGVLGAVSQEGQPQHCHSSFILPHVKAGQYQY